MADLSWHEQARCRGEDPDLFFPSDGDSGDAARWYCRRCPVARQCLEHAMQAPERHGVWGGLSATQRTSLRTGGRRVA